MTEQALRPTRRLRSRAQFQALLAHRPVARTAHFALHCLHALTPAAPTDAAIWSTAPQAAWLGAMVPKRWARRAVTRNAIRRLIYTVGADASHPFDGARLIRLHAGFAPAQFPSASSSALKRAVHAELHQLLNAGATR